MANRLLKGPLFEKVPYFTHFSEFKKNPYLDFLLYQAVFPKATYL